MKAELQKIKDEVAKEENDSTWEKLLDWEQLNIYDIVIERYARLQIEKDRERVKADKVVYEDGTEYVLVSNMDETPIILD